MGRLRAWWGHTVSVYRLAVQCSPQWVRLVMAACLGAMIAVLIGLADSKGDGIRVYIGIAGLVLASLAGYMSSRINNEAADRKEVRRQINLCLARIEDLRDAMTLLLDSSNDHQKVVASKTPSDVAIFNVASTVHVVAKMAQERPDFSAFMDTDDDRKQARIVGLVFARAAGEDIADFWGEAPATRNARIARFLTANTPKVQLNIIKILSDAGSYLDKRLKAL